MVKHNKKVSKSTYKQTSKKVFDGAKFNYKDFMVSDSKVVIKGIRSLLGYYSKTVDNVNELNFKSNDAKQKAVAALYVYAKKNIKNRYPPVNWGFYRKGSQKRAFSLQLQTKLT